MGYMRKSGKKAIKHVGEYVDNRLIGLNKRDSALNAGYALETAETPSLIERTKAYAEIITFVLIENGDQMRNVQKELGKYTQRSDADALFTMDMLSKTLLRLAQIEKSLAPQVTIKESTDKNGNKTVTKWGNTTVHQIA